MRLVIGLLVGMLGAGVANAQTVVSVDGLAWREARPGMATALLEGNPGTPGAPFAMAIRLEDGAWIPPHWHGIDKRILVVAGTMLYGNGEAIDTSAVQALAPGSFVHVPAETRHYEGGRGRTTIVLYGTGPLTTTFVRQE